MQLPRGTLAKNYRGPGTLASVTENILKDNLTGYLRVSILSDNASECVVVYLAAKPVMAFVTRANVDRPDPGLTNISSSIQQADSIIEICNLGEKQVTLLQELYGNLAYSEPRPQPVAAEKPAAAMQPWPSRGREAAPATQTPVKAISKPQPRFVMPEIRGRFVRSEELGDIREYIDRYPDDTGHLLFVIERNGTPEEQHVIIACGCIEAVYDNQKIVQGMPVWLEGVHGIAEFYAVEPGVLTSALQRSLKSVPGISKAEPPAPVPVHSALPETPKTVSPLTSQAPSYTKPQVTPMLRETAPKKHTTEAVPTPLPTEAPAARPVDRSKTIGVPAREILEKSRLSGAGVVGEDISRMVDEISKSMDDDVAMVRKVEQDFASNAGELLDKLDLGHLRKDRRKQG